MNNCYSCKGTGRRHAAMIGDVGKCMDCNGTGRVVEHLTACAKCEGSGWFNAVVAVVECSDCAGKGKLPVVSLTCAKCAKTVPAFDIALTSKEKSWCAHCRKSGAWKR